MNRHRKIAAHYAYLSGKLIPSPLLEIDENGVITSIRSENQRDGMHAVEFFNGILLPGLVNCHCHLELSHMLGAIESGCGPAGFAAGMSDARDKVAVEERMASIRYRDIKMWQEGISLVGDVSNGNTTLATKADSRVIYHTFCEVYGLGLKNPDRGTNLMNQARDLGLNASVTPHSIYSLNEELFSHTIVADPGGILSIHFMETMSEKQLFTGEGELYNWYKTTGMQTDFTGIYLSPAERIVKSVPKNRKILLVHTTYVSREDIDLLDGHFGYNATWVICPRSNIYISGQLPPVSMLLSKGLNIAVGTDSLASNRDLSLIEELKLIKGVKLETMLGWITSGGASALDWHDGGNIEVGKAPGLVLLEGVDLCEMTLTAKSKTVRIV